MSNTAEYRIEPVTTADGIRYQILNRRRKVVDSAATEVAATSKLAWRIRSGR